MMLLLLAAVFLPLFPLSMVFNGALGRLRMPYVRALLILVWPQIGLLVLQIAGSAIPEFFLVWALLSSGFYALRLLSVRDLGMWAGFLASSSLALGWVLAAGGDSMLELQLFAFGFSLPAALLALLAGPLTDRFGAAYAGLPGGLAGVMPRLSGLLIIAALAAIATPPFPAFFGMLALWQGLSPEIVLGSLLIWLIWSWAAIRLVQGFMIGDTPQVAVADIGQPAIVAFGILLFAFTVLGLYLLGGAL